MRADRSAPVEAIVQTDFDSLLFVADTGIKPAVKGEVATSEVVVLIFDQARPVLGEHIFQTAADGVPVASAVAGAIQAIRDAGVCPSITALNVQQRRTPGVA